MLRSDRCRRADAYLHGLHEIPGWIEQLGGETISIAPPPDMFPPVFPGWPHFPGADGVDHRIFAAADGVRPGEALWHLLDENVARRGIEVSYETTACELALGDGGEVTGVRVRDLGGSGLSTIDAARVILASGGFEGNEAMKDAYLPLAPRPPVGHAANDGAGVLMAQRVGAALWHMYGFFGWLAFRTPDYPAAFTIDVHGRSHVLVDADGRRFSDELGWEVHDKLRSITAETLEMFNAGAREGRDPLFGRAADTLAPLETDRLYAIELCPAWRPRPAARGATAARGWWIGAVERSRASTPRAGPGRCGDT